MTDDEAAGDVKTTNGVTHSKAVEKDNRNEKNAPTETYSMKGLSISQYHSVHFDTSIMLCALCAQYLEAIYNV